MKIFNTKTLIAVGLVAFAFVDSVISISIKKNTPTTVVTDEGSGIIKTQELKTEKTDAETSPIKPEEKNSSDKPKAKKQKSSKTVTNPFDIKEKDQLKKPKDKAQEPGKCSDLNPCPDTMKCLKINNETYGSCVAK